MLPIVGGACRVARHAARADHRGMAGRASSRASSPPASACRWSCSPGSSARSHSRRRRSPASAASCSPSCCDAADVPFPLGAPVRRADHGPDRLARRPARTAGTGRQPGDHHARRRRRHRRVRVPQRADLRRPRRRRRAGAEAVRRRRRDQRRDRGRLPAPGVRARRARECSPSSRSSWSTCAGARRDRTVSRCAPTSGRPARSGSTSRRRRCSPSACPRSSPVPAGGPDRLPAGPAVPGELLDLRLADAAVDHLHRRHRHRARGRSSPA